MSLSKYNMGLLKIIYSLAERPDIHERIRLHKCLFARQLDQYIIIRMRQWGLFEIDDDYEYKKTIKGRWQIFRSINELDPIR